MTKDNFVPADSKCEKCPEGVCDRDSEGKCIIYNDGYHCLLGAGDVKCNYESRCFEHQGQKMYNWMGISANLNFDKCYTGKLIPIYSTLCQCVILVNE